MISAPSEMSGRNRRTWAQNSTERGKRVAHRLVTIVTDLTKVLDGVRTVVVWVEDYNFQLTGQYLVHALGAGFVFIHVPDNTQRLGGPS